jgi:hypothetical protein
MIFAMLAWVWEKGLTMHFSQSTAGETRVETQNYSSEPNLGNIAYFDPFDTACESLLSSKVLKQFA